VTVHDLPTVNACLNAASALLLAAGYRAIRRRQRRRHARLMLAAVCTSALFLISYVAYHSQVGSVRFEGRGLVRAFYLIILTTHAVLALAISILVPLTLTPAIRGTFERHRRRARITLPLWLYVSLTGVLVYWMLYHL
jgi:uncharacterized membrane protein YozB (DUF420 family)